MERRKFLHTTFLTGIGSLISLRLLAKEDSPFIFGKQKNKIKKITILHTNDTHSAIEPLPNNHSNFPNAGGYAKRYEMVSKIRKETDHVILLDAGDIFQGTPYFNRYKGVLEMQLMSKMGYDVATLGNHDFDLGIEGWLNASEHATFNFVNANYDISNEALRQKVQPYQILQKGNVKIGVFGIGINLEGLVPAAKREGVIYKSAIQCANEMAQQLKKEKCDMVICLSHLGYDYEDKTKISDLLLAKSTQNIDLIIGGHTHTFLKEPTLIKNSVGKTVIVNQVGWGGIELGRLDFEIEKNVSLRNNKTMKI